ncbi:hypothetical protein ABZ840_15475 [Streptomyces sp. NPDC047117]|uniref:hypothetical protein n=1 Tax=Streptomyces sp. NPDC047117 TaxID=3155379 RepID=UPI003408BFA2
MNALRAARRSPVAAAVLTVLLLHLLGTLPQQVDWADRSTGDRPLSALRLLTVSPTLRFTEATGAPAVLQEALWTVLFLVLLAAAAAGFAARATGRAKIMAVAVVFPVFAPLAHLLALACLRLPELSFDPALRGQATLQLLMDAQAGTGHAVLIGLLGGQVAQLTGVLGADTEESGLPLRERLHAVTRRFRARLDTLWPQIGSTLLATAGGALVLSVLLSDAPGRVLEPLVRLWCAPDELPKECGIWLREQVGNTDGTALLAGEKPRTRQFMLFYAWQTFLALYLVTHLCVSVTTAGLARVPRVLLSTWAAYTLGAIGFVGGLEAAGIPEGAAAAADPLARQLLMLLPPHGLEHALYGAPVAAAVCAGTVWAGSRLIRRGTRPDPAPTPAPDTRPVY